MNHTIVSRLRSAQDDNFFVEADSSLQLWCNALNEFLLDSSVQVTPASLRLLVPFSLLTIKKTDQQLKITDLKQTKFLP